MSLLVSPAVRPFRDGSDLFTATRTSTPRPGWSTPRAAFQSLLAGDATLVDVRSPEDRLAGRVPTRLGVTTADFNQLDQLAVDSVVVVLAGDDELAELAARSLAARGLTATALAGGLPAWRAAGMPVSS